MRLIQEAQAVFLKGMATSSWATGAKSIPIVELPGYKAVSFRDGDFLLVDMWAPGDKRFRFSGSTTISFQETVIWAMHYQGFCSPRASPILRKILLDTYKKGIFWGGRGEQCMSVDDKWRYYNLLRAVSQQHSFFHFSGEENLQYSPGCIQEEPDARVEYFGQMVAHFDPA
ncbi:MAG: hypothetical protein PHV93_03420 [Candidatus Pacebacteria bacterium]|nr:hypothetical protein [Candidatus Paceibacterota bacterium]